MPRRRRVYILRIEDYLGDPPPPPSRALRILLRTALGLLLIVNIVLAFGWLFSLIPPAVFEIAIAVVIAYTIILAVFIALSRSIHHVD
jgi:membrane protein YdbS with pleckstrin-like domain